MRLDPKLITDRLRARCPAFREVGGSGELAAALKDARALPGAYVVPTRESPIGRQTGSQVVRQRAKLEFTVVLIVRNYSEKLAAAADALRPCVNQVQAALENWKPLPAMTGCAWEGGQTHDYRSDQIVWEERYSTETSTTRGDNP